MWYNGKNEHKILAWRNFRKELSSWPEDLDKVAKAWGAAPLVNHYLTADDITNWPDPWTLVNESIYCDAARALGMFYTLWFSSYPHKETMSIRHFRLKDKHEELMLLFCDNGATVLNYDINRVTLVEALELPEPLCIITHQDLKVR